jgi:hypothetical protein
MIEVRTKMVQALSLIKQAVDLSLPLVKSGGRESMKILWEEFLKEFIRYIKLKSRETGVNLISLISISRILR